MNGQEMPGSARYHSSLEPANEKLGDIISQLKVNPKKTGGETSPPGCTLGRNEISEIILENSMKRL